MTKRELALNIANHSGVGSYHLKNMFRQFFDLSYSVISDKSKSKLSSLENSLINTFSLMLIEESSYIIESEFAEKELEELNLLLDNPVLVKFLKISINRQVDYAKISNKYMSMLCNEIANIVRKIDRNDYRVLEQILLGNQCSEDDCKSCTDNSCDENSCKKFN